MQTVFALLSGAVLFASIYWLLVQIDQYKAEKKDLKQRFKHKNKIK